MSTGDDGDKRLPISLAVLIASLPNLTRMKLILPRCYVKALQSSLNANQTLASLRSLTVSSSDWIFFIRISQNLEMFHAENRSSRSPMREALVSIRQFPNITRFSCFERSTAVVISFIAQYLPHLRELGLIAPLDTSTIIVRAIFHEYATLKQPQNNIKAYRQFPYLCVIWLPPLQLKTVEGVPGQRRHAITDVPSVLEAIENQVIGDYGPDVRKVKVGWNQLLEIYERRGERSFRKTMEVTIDVSLRKEVVT
ncbi:hypothetical protein FRC17_009227 [Serendipita sp. 399]|nr:hypothetical protein FRC17_009227 [Serendipita sp. 399]